jgi:hypothetical protein
MMVVAVAATFRQEDLARQLCVVCQVCAAANGATVARAAPTATADETRLFFLETEL